MRTLRQKFPKEAVAELPVAQFEGRITVISHEREAERAVAWLLRQPLLGFDTETRPNFTRGRLNTVALLQVATRDTAFLFRLNRMGLPPCLERLLTLTTEGTPTRVGLSWGDDKRSLARRRAFECAPFVELQEMAHSLGIEDMSLAKLFANIVGGRISKRQQLSNWEAQELTPKQQLYAATDAWACVVMYEEMTRLMTTGDYELITDDENDTTETR